MTTLRALDEKHVHAFINREFSKLPPAPRLTTGTGSSSSSHVRVLNSSMSSSTASNGANSRLRSGGGGGAAGNSGKLEVAYRGHVLQCVQRICVQCFGLPRFFAFILVQLIGLAERVAAGGGGGRKRNSSSNSSSLLGGGASSSPHQHQHQPPLSLAAAVQQLTARQVKEFYDTHLTGKDCLRRIFDVLILSSRLAKYSASTAAAGATGGGGGFDAGDDDMSSGPLRSFLLPEDFAAYLQVLLIHHPGLAFLRDTPDFQDKYLLTVTYRIFYECDRLDRGRILFSEFTASRLVDALRQVDATDDINTVLAFFSYEHFYVLYCRFWELDEDRDMLLSKADFSRYLPEDIMNPLIIDRVFDGVGRRVRATAPGMIGYEDFVWFCLAEEDKSDPAALRYWFRILDLDGDGVLSLYELSTFYTATRDKIAQYVADGVISFEDVVCQVLDMLRCRRPTVLANGGLRLGDLLREREAAAVAVGMLTNVIRFLQYEQRDPFVAHQERLLGGPEQSAWDRFARAEYDRMAQEVDE